MVEEISMYCVITADINRSRDIKDREALQERMQKAIALINEQFTEQILVPFTITLGDEWQGLLKSLAKSYEIVATFRDALEGVSVSYGIGEGAIATPLLARTSEMDGEAFHKSREALDTAKQNHHEVVFATRDERTDLLLNATCSLLETIRANWTERQREKIMAYKKYGTETKVAEVLGVTQGDIHQAIRAGAGKIYLQCENQVNEFLSLGK